VSCGLCRSAVPALFWALGSLLLACGGQTANTDNGEISDDDRSQRAAIDALGHELYDAIIASAPLRVLAEDAVVREVVDDDAADRYGALRLAVASRVGEVAPHAFVDTEYAGICLQGLRREAEGGPVGLRREGWVFDRALIVAVQPRGQRVAAWVEGVFAKTGNRFVAIDLHRVEDPRWEHSDLEIAHCDVQIGMRQPQDVGMVTP